MSEFEVTIIDRVILVEVLIEIRQDLSRNGICQSDKAWLYHQMGTIYGQLGKNKLQKKSWEKAKELDPENAMIKASLESLTQ
jgi:hypothetical protein